MKIQLKCAQFGIKIYIYASLCCCCCSHLSRHNSISRRATRFHILTHSASVDCKRVIYSTTRLTRRQKNLCNLFSTMQHSKWRSEVGKLNTSITYKRYGNNVSLSCIWMTFDVKANTTKIKYFTFFLDCGETNRHVCTRD